MVEDPDYKPPEEELEGPDLSHKVEGVQDVAVGVSHWVDRTPRVELDLLMLWQQARWCRTCNQQCCNWWRYPENRSPMV